MVTKFTLVVTFTLRYQIIQPKKRKGYFTEIFLLKNS